MIKTDEILQNNHIIELYKYRRFFVAIFIKKCIVISLKICSSNKNHVHQNEHMFIKTKSRFLDVDYKVNIGIGGKCRDLNIDPGTPD